MISNEINSLQGEFVKFIKFIKFPPLMVFQKVCFLYLK